MESFNFFTYSVKDFFGILIPPKMTYQKLTTKGGGKFSEVNP